MDLNTNPEIDGIDRTEDDAPSSCVWPDVWRDHGGCYGCYDCEVNP